MKREKYEPVLKNISYFIKWVEGAIVIGIVSGCIGTAFGKCVLWVSAFFQSHPWMVFLLPLTGLLVLGVYHVLGESNNRGTNMVIESIYSNTEISFATAPAVVEDIEVAADGTVVLPDGRARRCRWEEASEPRSENG